MQKIIFILLLYFIASQASEELPKDFLLQFENYKKGMISKDSKSLYQLEVPHFRYLNDFEKYEAYINTFTVFDDVIISKKLEENDDIIKIVVGLKLKNTKDMVYFTQTWYNIYGKYFVLTNNELLFKY